MARAAADNTERYAYGAFGFEFCKESVWIRTINFQPILCLLGDSRRDPKKLYSDRNFFEFGHLKPP